jgi:hypothetical protein
MRGLSRVAVAILGVATIAATGSAGASTLAPPNSGGAGGGGPDRVGASRLPGARQATAPAFPLLPPAGSVFTGVSAGPADAFAGEVGKHPAVYGEFVTWGQSIGYAFDHAATAHDRLMLHISTTQGYGARPVITPAGIAQGDGDRYLLTLSALIASRHKPVYVRLLPEMDQANNAYCAFNADGSSRGPANSPSEFIAAWRRVVVVLRGGPARAINARLAALGQPRLHGIGAGGSVARSQISFIWTPQTAGSPDTAANAAAAYYPGDDYVDWVGTDFYSKFPNFPGLDAFYKQYANKPFAFGEWAIWGGDSPGFVDQLFSWVGSHKRVQMMLYNQGYVAGGPFRLSSDPASTAAIRQRLAPARFLATTPEW